MSRLSGGCQCGNIRFSVNSEPVDIYLCHCRECQKQSSSAFGISVLVKSSDLVLEQGEVKRWSRPAPKMGTMVCSFCPDCGVRLWHGDEQKDELISLKGGSLDLVPDLASVDHIWTCSQVKGLKIKTDGKVYEIDKPRPYEN